MAKAIENQWGGKVRPINLVCRGSSGAIIAALVAQYLLNKGEEARISHVKKEGEKSHSSGVAVYKSDFTIIVDDFISSGETMRKIYQAISSDTNKPTIHGIVITGDICNLTLNFQPEVIICGVGDDEDLRFEEVQL